VFSATTIMAKRNMAYSPTVRFEPWEGKDYREGISRKRILILGESHYHSCNKPGDKCNGLDAEEQDARHRGLTISEVKWWKDNPHSTPLSTAIPKLFGMTKSDLWSDVAFYNYVQTLSSAARIRPSTEAWEDQIAVTAFQEVLDVLEPDRILVLGKDLWKSLPSDEKLLACVPRPEIDFPLLEKIGSRTSVDGVAYWYGCRTGHSALAMPISRPASWGVRVKEWVPQVQTWINFPSPKDPYLLRP
jgi:hypothetical protein